MLVSLKTYIHNNVRKYLITKNDTKLLFVAFVGATLMLLSLSALINPASIGQTGFNSSVNVAATAQAIQFQNRRTELKTTLQGKKAVWDGNITEKQQLLTEFSRNSQVAISTLAVELTSLQTEINQTSADIKTVQTEIIRLQQSIQDEEIKHRKQLITLEANLKQTQQLLKTAREQLQTAYAELDNIERVAKTTSTISR